VFTDEKIILLEKRLGYERERGHHHQTWEHRAGDDDVRNLVLTFAKETTRREYPTEEFIHSNVIFVPKHTNTTTYVQSFKENRGDEFLATGAKYDN